jgi:hypothetical protein
MNVVPDVLKTIGPGGIVVHFNTPRQFLFQSTTQILTEYKGKRREQELHDKEEDNKDEVLKETD